ncbi:MAG TPA: site-specific integrase [Stellaceae bacterium]|nr:site-specific integrase [Stellaceae bacterium]
MPDTLRTEAEAAASFAKEQHARATRKAYRTDFSIFGAWCASRALVALPASPGAVATFLAAQAQDGVKPSTLSRRLAAIRYVHASANHPSPTTHEAVKATLAGIRRTRGVAPDRKAPITAERLLQMVALVPDTLHGTRDRAILLLGFAGALRRSELAALEVRDLAFLPEGLRVTIRHSKTDQEAEGQAIAIVRGACACPVEAVRLWLERAKITAGPVFRPVTKGGRLTDVALTPPSVSLIVKTYAGRAGFNVGEFGAHSLRAGFLTSAAMRGASIFKMMDVSRHKSVDTLRSYVRDADAFKNHAGAGLL